MKGEKAGVNDEKCHYREEQKLRNALKKKAPHKYSQLNYPGAAQVATG